MIRREVGVLVPVAAPVGDGVAVEVAVLLGEAVWGATVVPVAVGLSVAVAVHVDVAV